MKVLSIGTDRKLFEDGSAVLVRSHAYASKMEELHIIVFSKKGFTNKSINNLHIYPTNSSSKWFYISDAIKLGKKIIMENKFVRGNSVISSQDPFETGLVGHSLKKKFRLPLQLQLHTDFLSKSFRSSFLNYLRVKVGLHLLKKADSVRVVDEGIAKSIMEKIPNLKTPIYILPVFIDIEKIINAEPKKDLKKEFPQFKFLVFMASRLSPEKRIDIALKSFKKALENFHDSGLIIAGSGSERAHLESMARELKIEKNVVFIGWQNDLVSYFKTTDAFLLTSDYEGYGMTLIEAGASGCPIITTKVGVAKTEMFVNDENSLVCPVGDIECLAKAINKLVSNNSERELFKRAIQARIKSKSMTKEEYISKYIGLLEKIQK